MAHKTLINGTAYGISGGKTRVNGTNYSIGKGKTLVGGTAYSISFGPAPEGSTLNACSWANISAIAASGNAPNYWAVGDWKDVTMAGTIGTRTVNITRSVFILGFNHNGAANTIDFGTERGKGGGTYYSLIDDMAGTGKTDGTLRYNINHWGNTTYGGWKGCDLRYDVLGSTNVAPSGYGAKTASGRTGYDATSTCATSPVANTYMAALPSDLRAVMKPMTIYTDNTGGVSANSSLESAVTASIDYLPLLAEFEIFGVRSKASRYEQNYQKQYAFYANGGQKSKSASYNNSGWIYSYWTRSCNNTNPFVLVIEGVANTCACNYSYGISPIFRV